MRMGRVEKVFVNSARHSGQVARQAVERLRSLPVRRGQCYLDVGCGNGAAAIAVATAYALDVTGVDLDGEQVRAAEHAGQRVGGVTFRLGDATNLPFSDASFDIVATNKTTHHIPRWREALAEMTRVVTPGGYVVYADVTVPASMAPPLRPLLGRAAGVFTWQDLDRWFQALGLDAVHQSRSSWHYEAVLRKPCEPSSAPAAASQTSPAAPTAALGGTS